MEEAEGGSTTAPRGRVLCQRWALAVAPGCRLGRRAHPATELGMKPRGVRAAADVIRAAGCTIPSPPGGRSGRARGGRTGVRDHRARGGSAGRMTGNRIVGGWGEGEH